MHASPPERFLLVDAIKAVGSQLIVLHHLAFYGPMSDRALPLAPQVIAWFSDHARLAVQAFLVVGGFLAARALAPDGRSTARSLALLVPRRYLRLAVPSMAAVVVAIAAAALARTWMQHPSIPGPPSLPQAVANLLLLQDLLGYEALSAGLWYVAIDFQLFVVLAALLRMAPGRAMAGVAALAVASLFYFNRDPRWDVWAVYFFASYAFGALAWWLARRACPPVLGGLILAAALAALALDFRIRIAVALTIAVLLFAATRAGARLPRVESPVIAFLARISYSVFLVHFPVCLVVNAAWTRYLPADPWTSLAGLVVAWGASIAAGWLLHRLVESRVDAIVVRLGGTASAVRRARAAAE